MTSGLVGISSRNFSRRRAARRGWFVQLLKGRPRKIWEGQKTSKFRRDFWQLSTLIANISGTDQHIEHLKKLIQPQPLPRWVNKSCCTLVHKQKKLLSLIYTVSGKKRVWSISGITSSNSDLFLKFFHYYNLQEICSKAVVKYLTTP